MSKADQQDLREEVERLRRFLLAAPENCCAGLAAQYSRALEMDAQSPIPKILRETIRGFQQSDLRLLLNGWSVLPKPRRRVVQAELELASLIRVLSLTAGVQGVSASHQVVLRDGEPLVRVEIREGATRAEVLNAIGRVAGVLALAWEELIDAKAAERLTDQMDGKARVETEGAAQ